MQMDLSVPKIRQIAIVLMRKKRLPSQRPGSHSCRLKTKSVHDGLFHSVWHYIPRRGALFHV
jgi:hypothetical protein